MAIIRGILIDPRLREVREVFDEFNTSHVIHQYLAQGERGLLLAALGTMAKLGPDIHAYVDDEGLFRDDQCYWSMPQTDGTPYIVAGYALVLSVSSDGYEESVPQFYKPADFASRISWISEAEALPHIPPIRTYSFDGAGNRKLIGEYPIDFTRREPYRRVEL